jgi:PBP1b-binding outer membrane lipoprotein LpoB
MTLTRTLLTAITLALTLSACGKSEQPAEKAPAAQEQAAQGVEQPKDAAAVAAEEAEKKKAAEQGAAPAQ